MAGSGVRAVFFDADHAEAAAARLRRDGFEAQVRRERFAGEDDDEDQPWALATDAPAGLLELLVEEHDGWVEHDTPPAPPAPLRLPTAPRRAHRGVGGDS